MEPAEKAGSGEITIAISRSILSNKRSKAVRRMPDGLAAFGGTNPLSHLASLDARFPLLSPAVTSSPGAGEVFPLRGALLLLTGKCKKLPLSGELARRKA